jgi:methionyl-tRNA formyltransferase
MEAQDEFLNVLDMTVDSERKNYRVLFLGYLWRVAKCLHQSPNWNLVGVGLELNRKKTSEALKFCEKQSIPWIDAKNLKSNKTFFDLLQKGLDLIVVGAFGQIISKDILETPRLGILNIHTSFLPHYQGGTPIEEQILRGDSKGGVTLHWMTEKVDEGPIVAQQAINIKPTYYYEDILHRYHLGLTEIFGKLLSCAPEYWPRISQTVGEYNTPRGKKDALLDWHLSSHELTQKIRAFGGRGWCEASLPDGKKILVTRAVIHENSGAKAPGQLILNEKGRLVIATRDGALKILEWTEIAKLNDLS